MSHSITDNGDRKDYRVTIKVRNNNILMIAANAGYTSMPKLALASGIGYNMLNDLINMTVSPFAADGNVRPSVDALCIFLGATFDDLFSSEQCEALISNKTEREISAEKMYLLTNISEDFARIDHDDGLKDHINSLVGTLTPREALVINMRYGFDGREPMTLDATGIAMGVTPERIRQIEAKAMRKLRHPSRSTSLLCFLEAE